MICPWCRREKRVEYYRAKRERRCVCDDDYRTPVEARRDAVLERYGADPDAYTPEVLAALARDGLFDVSAAFCPAGKLSMDEVRKRERGNLA